MATPIVGQMIHIITYLWWPQPVSGLSMQPLPGRYQFNDHSDGKGIVYHFGDLCFLALNKHRLSLGHLENNCFLYASFTTLV